MSAGAEPYAIGKGGRAVTARLQKTYVGNLDDRYVGFFVEVRDRESRKPQDFLHLGQAPGSIDVGIRISIGIVVMLAREQFRIACRLIAEIHTQLVNPPVRAYEPVPMPEGWRQRQRTD